MRIAETLERWGRGWRAPLLAAALALLAGLPGVLFVPPIDRDESRFAEASAQMIETGDFVTIRFQDQPRFKKPVGIYWLQAAAVEAVSHVEDRRIWAYRLPSLAGAMLAAAACAWGAGAFLRPGLALLAGGLMGGGFLLSTEAGIAATDAALCGAVTLMMAALARLYLAARGGPRAPILTRAFLWGGLALGLLLKGPIAPMVLCLTLATLIAVERRGRWVAGLGWGWGLIATAALVLPWALAVTVATDGAFWSQAVGGDLAPKLAGGQEGHAAPFGLHLALAPLLLFPATFLAPGAVAAAWRYRHEPAVRFALAWLAPSWLVFEATPTKLVHYTLPLFAPVIWLAMRGLAGPQGRLAQGLSQRLGAVLGFIVALAFAAAGPLVTARLGVPTALPWAGLTALLFLAAGVVGARGMWAGRGEPAVLGALILAIAAHGAMAGGLVPALHPLWLSDEIARRLSADGANPRDGVVQGPVTVAGYAEPSLVFLLGADTELGDASAAAQALAEGRPAIVEARQDAAFQADLRREGIIARAGGQARGLDYSKGRPDILTIYLPQGPAQASPPDAQGSAPSPAPSKRLQP